MEPQRRTVQMILIYMIVDENLNKSSQSEFYLFPKII
jgi:hypothetical protein